MDTVQYNITLGTAGHIDHGKTALIKCLTGCDTDHLKAEKERGMSIDLGFAPCTVSDLEVGIVDVPGHENFIKTMVAGASGIDGVIFVIAADDGVMPQTREHFDILTLLGVRHGIVALTKVDCVAPERVEKVTAEIKAFLAGTFLEKAPICPVSSITGQGFDIFYEALKELVGSIEPKKTDGVFRLPVERVFSVKGYGTVVSGIPICGAAKIGDELTLFPHGVKGRIKAIQVYKRQSDTAVVGQCAAINVPQWDYKTIKRGCCATVAEYFSPQQWFLCTLRILPDIKTPLKNGADVKFHTGTSEIVASAFLLKGNNISAREESIVQIRLNEPVVAGPGDRFILRSLSPVNTIGGGMIIEEIPHKLKRNNPDVLQDAQNLAKAILTGTSFVEYAIKTAPAFAAGRNELAAKTKMLPKVLNEFLEELTGGNKITDLGSGLFIHRDTLGRIRQKLLDIVADFHRKKPESPGLTVEQLYEESGFKKDVSDGLLKMLLAGKKLIEKKNRIALPEHRESFSDDEQKLIHTIESLFIDRLFNPPSLQEMGEVSRTSQANVQKIIKILIEQQRLVRVDKDLFFHSDAVERAREILVTYIQQQGGLESVKFKYLLDTSRKFAIPLLDYFDRIGLTRRSGYTRYLRNPSSK
ncbi:MAG: selenocysteine-specific translation elongation factor [Sedimentisphaerales bacterium]|nr:selenocysteine-specific translation elongation factor [Sedimentisphaerales bacterium]